MQTAKLLAIIFGITTLVAVTPAEARKHHSGVNHTQARHHQHYAAPRNAQPATQLDVAAIPAYPTEMTRTGPRPSPMGRRLIAPSNGWTMAEGVIGGRPAGCPRAYCGCSASIEVFGRIIPELNLASNWGQFPSASPAPGMAAYRHHHVFIIRAVNGDGTVLAHDGNSGRGLTRIHTVSLRGYRVVNPTAQRIASRVTSIR